ncbi:DNA-processing protein DprA, partial [Streptomyces caniscabiei]
MTDDERLARVALARIVEPGDEVGGRWLRQYGARKTLQRLTTDGEPLPWVTPKRWEALRARAAHARPERDLADAAAAGVRFLVPGDGEWPGQLDDLGDGRPVGLWVRGAANVRMWALRSVAVVGARACTEYGAHMAATLGAGLA